MTRSKGTISLSADFEVQKAGPLDARQRVATRADLLLAATWTANDGNFYSPEGISVVVNADTTPEYNGVYWLSAVDYTDINNWEKLGAGVSDAADVPIGTTYKGLLAGVANQKEANNVTNTLLLGRTVDDIQRLEQADNRVICILDSNSYHNIEYAPRMPPYPWVLQDLLREDSYYVIDQGVGGNTSADMLSRFATDVTPNYIKHARNILIFLGGMNDAVASVSTTDWWTDTSSIISQAIALGFEVIYLHYPPKNSDATVSGFINGYNAKAESEKGTLGFTTYDLSTAVSADNLNWDNSAFISGDGIHFTTAGAAHVAYLVSKVVSRKVGLIADIPTDIADGADYFATDISVQFKRIDNVWVAQSSSNGIDKIYLYVDLQNGSDTNHGYDSNNPVLTVQQGYDALPISIGGNIEIVIAGTNTTPVLNDDFTTDTGWIYTGGMSLDAVNDRMDLASAGTATVSLDLEPNQTYLLQMSITKTGGSGLYISFAGEVNSYNHRASMEIDRLVRTPNNITNSTLLIQGNGLVGYIDNVVVQKIDTLNAIGKTVGSGYEISIVSAGISEVLSGTLSSAVSTANNDGDYTYIDTPGTVDAAWGQNDDTQSVYFANSVGYYDIFNLVKYADNIASPKQLYVQGLHSDETLENIIASIVTIGQASDVLSVYSPTLMLGDVNCDCNNLKIKKFHIIGNYKILGGLVEFFGCKFTVTSNGTDDIFTTENVTTSGYNRGVYYPSCSFIGGKTIFRGCYLSFGSLICSGGSYLFNNTYFLTRNDTSLQGSTWTQRGSGVIGLGNEFVGKPSGLYPPMFNIDTTSYLDIFSTGSTGYYNRIYGCNNYAIIAGGNSQVIGADRPIYYGPTIISSTADGTTANHLIDSTQTFSELTGAWSYWVHNTTDDTWAIITVVASGNLTLNADIFISGETYTIHIGSSDSDTLPLSYSSNDGGLIGELDINFSGSVTSTGGFNGPGTGLTGTAASLSIGGNAGTATSAATAATASTITVTLGTADAWYSLLTATSSSGNRDIYGTKNLSPIVVGINPSTGALYLKGDLYFGGALITALPAEINAVCDVNATPANADTRHTHQKIFQTISAANFNLTASGAVIPTSWTTSFTETGSFASSQWTADENGFYKLELTVIPRQQNSVTPLQGDVNTYLMLDTGGGPAYISGSSAVVQLPAIYLARDSAKSDIELNLASGDVISIYAVLSGVDSIRYLAGTVVFRVTRIGAQR